MSAEKIRMWYVRETEKARQYTKIPPDRLRQQEDYVWVPKSITEHRSMQPNGLHELTLPLWFLEKNNLILLLILCLLAGCSVSQPRPKRYMQLPLPGGGTYNYFAPRYATNETLTIRAASAGKTNIFTWRYDLPLGTVSSNWFWDLQVAKTLGSQTNWKTIRTNVSGIIDVTTTNAPEFFRLKGRM